MKRFTLLAALLFTVLVASATPASARYFYRRPVARAAVRVALPPYRVVGPRAYYGPAYGPRYYGYGPRYYGYGPGWGYGGYGGYGPRAYVGVGIY